MLLDIRFFKRTVIYEKPCKCFYAKQLYLN